MALTNTARATAPTAEMNAGRIGSGSSGGDDDERGGTRGRRMERDRSNGAKGEDESGEDDAKHGGGTGPRKRKRSRKGLDKKYVCPHEGCGKSYSRAEHLYRHQLNHSPKQIYNCDFPDCPRWFVRQDLCARHRERHTTRGSHLQRKDNQAPLPEAGSATDNHSQQMASASPTSRNELSINTATYSNMSPVGPASASVADNYYMQSSHLGANSGETYHSAGPFHRSNSDSHYYNPDTQGLVTAARSSYGNAPSNLGASTSSPADYSMRYHPSIKSNGHYTVTSPIEHAGSPTHFKRPSSHHTGFAANQDVTSDFNYAPLNQIGSIAPLPPPAFTSSTHAMTPNQSNSQTFTTANAFMQPSMGQDEMSGLITNASNMGDIPMGVFDPDEYTRSPTVLADNFAAWLFNEQYSHTSISHQRRDSQILDPSLRIANGGLPATPVQDPMAVASILGTTAPGSIISEKKRQALLELIRTRFNETGHSAVAKQKDRIFAGDVDQDGHILSLRSLQTYIGSYWYHFHDQMPILHRPTFSVDNSQSLLLVMVIAIGAANLGKMHGQEKTSASAELANFLAWHVRGDLFMDKDFPPPTRIWVLQALLLLEAYEKLYSSRVLHERSQIHHATTISLLRRGSTLLGRSALDSPPAEEEDGPHSTTIASTPDPWWNHWITTEATKRVALAAFIMDSTHATMFSHTAVMVAHEMRLRLPCDEILWAATSGVEVSRLRDQHGDPTPFLDGLKGTLNGRSIRTNAFGRAALMAGLLNVSFHLGQRDMQVRSLGVELGGKDRWRGTLTKAFDIWERDWDNNPIGEVKSAHASEPTTFSSSRWQGPSGKKEDEQLFESRTVLHHLAHMGMHVDIVQCQIFAGASRLLGRTITQSDRTNAERRMREMWAPKASARDAVFYSLRFLRQVLSPYLTPSSPLSTSTAPSSASGASYSPRDDYLLNRPWVLYFAALVVWTYGFALDGALPQGSVSDALLIDPSIQIEDMRTFMARVGDVAKPDDLSNVTGRNRCVGLLSILISSFRKCRWELLREAGDRLEQCVKKLAGRSAPAVSDLDTQDM